MSETVSTIVISQSGVLRKRELKKTLSMDDLILELESITQSRGGGQIKLIGEYFKHNIVMFGWTNGKHSQINKHEFAPPYDTDLFYGDVVLVHSLNKTNTITIDPIEIDKYSDIYEKLHEGFDSVCSDYSDEDDRSYVRQKEQEGYSTDPDYHPGDSEEEEGNDGYTATYDEEESKEDADDEWDFSESDTDE
tara:strand:+ start:684 stop:1259 length:576 start_codon:yes stop_codon:yes gene_type:complete